MRVLALVAVFLVASLLPRSSEAFCGFYVSGADTKLLNRATHVVLMRSGTRTVLSMQNNYEGPPQDFALVVPVPVVLQKEQVKTLPRDVLERVDQLGAPRLVEYWERDPCDVSIPSAGTGIGMGFGSGYGRLGGSHASSAPAVKIEAQFAVGEYEIVILSATDSTALDTWLRQNKYKIPDGAEPYLRPYVQAGMKFFVAKVDIEKAQMKDGRAVLSPLRFHYDSETFSLPIRLGLINAGDAQDLIVSILAQSQRYEVANYPNVVIPTNLDVADETRNSFGAFYAALLDETLKQKPGAVVTEYSWDSGTCDPCPGPTLSGVDVATLGGDAFADSQRPGGALVSGPPQIRLLPPQVTGRLPPEVIGRIVRQSLGRFRLCYEGALRRKPGVQGNVSIKLSIDRTGAVTSATVAQSQLSDPEMEKCVAAPFRQMSFPAPEGGVVTATQPIAFQVGARAGATGVVLTRLHMRYTREALGEDLVFKAAEPIRGGREVRVPGGGLEQGATLVAGSGPGLGGGNNFQARYAIRHPWTGPIACANPVRGVWGGPPQGAAPATKAALDLAFVQRGAGLGSFLPGGAVAVSGPTAAAATEPPPASASSSAAPAASSSSGTTGSATGTEAPGSGGGCGCRTAAGSRGLSGLWAAAAIMTLFVFRRRRGPGRVVTSRSP